MKLVPLVWFTLDKEGNSIQGDAETAALAIRDAIDVYECRIIKLSIGTYTDSSVYPHCFKYIHKVPKVHKKGSYKPYRFITALFAL